MNKKMITPILLIGLAGLAYYAYTKGWFTKKPTASDLDTDTSPQGKSAQKVGKLPTQAAVYKIGMKRPGAD
jgi:hypothetical protein